MAKDMNLTAEEVYSKEFHVDLKGYSPVEVDEFLDQVIEDYQEYDEKIKDLNEAVTRYEEKIKELQQELVVLRSDNKKLTEKLSTGFVDANNSDQVDILKRISRLEQAVFHNNRGNYNNYRGKNKNYNKNRQYHQQPQQTESSHQE